MIVLTFGDTHGEERALRKAGKKAGRADIILCNGDVTIFEHNLKRILKTIAGFGKPTLIVPGNHESETALRGECSKYSNMIYLHKDFYEKDGVVFCGYGGGGFSTVDREFERFTKKIMARSKGKKLVLLLHGPAYGNITDLMPIGHVGNKSYAEFIRQAKPVLVVSGHIHETNDTYEKVGKTLVINPGPEGELIKI
ncbi:MAG: metallophosphoesterase [archaeon]